MGMSIKELKDKIIELKREKDAVILAHYYVNDEVQQIADYVGDSFYLSKVASKVSEKVIVFCGVSFMGESAKIINPDKTVLMPDMTADCPMAHMVDIDKLKKIKEENEDIAVVCYINSSAQIKTYADVCVTSSNALKIVKKLPQKNIFFIPDENLGRYIAAQVPEKNFIFNDGYCPVHKKITKDDVLRAKNEHENALVLTHPECIPEVLDISDYIGSTSEIIDYSKCSDADEFIIATETGVFYELIKNSPDKHFYPVNKQQICNDMKLITLDKIVKVLEDNSNQVDVLNEVRTKAKASLEKMLELAK